MPQQKPWEKYAAPQSQVIAGNPLLPAQTIKATNDAAASQYAPGKAAAEQAIAQADAANAAIIAKAQADKAIADARAAEIALRGGKLPEGWRLRPDGSAEPIPGFAPKADGKAGARKALQAQLDRVLEIYRGKLKGGAPNPLVGWLPMEGNNSFDTAAQGLVNPFMAAFRVPGVGAQSDMELRQFLAANTPKATDTEATIEEKIRNLQTRIDAELPPTPPPGSGAAPAGERMDTSAPLTGPSVQEKPQLSNSARDEVDPFLRKVAGKVGQMVAAGRPDAEILKFMQDNGVDPGSTNAAEVFRYRKTPEYKAWQRQNPGKPYTMDSSFYTKKVSLSPVQKAYAMAANSSVGAYLGNAANAISGNHLKDFDPSIATGMELLRDERPVASLLGDATGQGLVQSALPFSRLGKLGQLVGDASYGALSSDGSAEGILSGAAINAGGGVMGRRIGDMGSLAMRGVKPSSSLAYLQEAKVPLTIGQIGRGTDNVFGKAIGGLEDRVAGMPGYDAVVNDARQRGIEGFNRAAFREGGGSGAFGAAGVNELGGKVDEAYKFLDGAQIPLDAQYAGTAAGIRARLPELPAFGPQIGSVMDTADRAAPNGMMTGRGWQDSLRLARSSAASIKGQPFADPAVSALGDVQDNLAWLASRQGPAGAADNLASANELYKNYRILTNALDNGPAQAGGELFSPVRLDTASRQSARKFGGQSGSIGGNRPFYDLSRAGMDVLPAQVPDSGTAGRAALMPFLYGGGTGATLGMAAGGNEGAQTGGGIGLATTLALMAPYSKVGQKGLQSLLLGARPKAVQAITKYLDDAEPGMVQSLIQGMFGRKAQSALGGAAAREVFNRR